MFANGCVAVVLWFFMFAENSAVFVCVLLESRLPDRATFPLFCIPSPAAPVFFYGCRIRQVQRVPKRFVAVSPSYPPRARRLPWARRWPATSTPSSSPSRPSSSSSRRRPRKRRRRLHDGGGRGSSRFHRGATRRTLCSRGFSTAPPAAPPSRAATAGRLGETLARATAASRAETAGRRRRRRATRRPRRRRR